MKHSSRILNEKNNNRKKSLFSNNYHSFKEILLYRYTMMINTYLEYNIFITCKPADTSMISQSLE